MKRIGPESGARAALRAQGYVPAREAAARLGYTTQTIYDWMDAEKIRGVRLAAGRWIEWKSLKEYFQSQSPEVAKLLKL